jgi:hypothetical protein
MSYQQPPPEYLPPPPPPRKRHRPRLILSIVAGFVILFVIAAAIGLGIGGGKNASNTDPDPASASPTATSTPPPSGGTGLTPGEAAFVKAILAHLASLGSTSPVSDQQIVGVGTKMICDKLQSGLSIVAVAHGLGPAPERVLHLTGRQLVSLANRDICPSVHEVPQTVTYVVTGTPGASVTYGPKGSSFSGYVPMRLTRHLGYSSYYSIHVQLQGYGSVTCEILVQGHVISKATASGGDNTATCEISRNPSTGQIHNDDDA